MAVCLREDRHVGLAKRGPLNAKDASKPRTGSPQTPTASFNDWAKKQSHTIEWPKSCDWGSVLRSGGRGADKRKYFRPKAKQQQTKKERLKQSCFYLKAFADPRELELLSHSLTYERRLKSKFPLMMHQRKRAKGNSHHREGEKERGEKPIFNTPVIRYKCSKSDRP